MLKKIICLLLAIVMVLSMTAALAEQEPVTISFYSTQAGVDNETVALLGALVFATKGKKADKHAPEKKKFTQLSVICIVAFVVLTTLRKTYLGA